MVPIFSFFFHAEFKWSFHKVTQSCQKKKLRQKKTAHLKNQVNRIYIVIKKQSYAFSLAFLWSAKNLAKPISVNG